MEITLDRSLAEEISDKIEALDEPLNNLMAAIEKIIDVEQRREFRRVVAGLVATVYTELQLPIAKRFPDLSTDEDDIRKTR
jgi:hypothetical protein